MRAFWVQWLFHVNLSKSGSIKWEVEGIWGIRQNMVENHRLNEFHKFKLCTQGSFRWTRVRCCHLGIGMWLFKNPVFKGQHCLILNFGWWLGRCIALWTCLTSCFGFCFLNLWSLFWLESKLKTNCVLGNTICSFNNVFKNLNCASVSVMLLDIKIPILACLRYPKDVGTSPVHILAWQQQAGD